MARDRRVRTMHKPERNKLLAVGAEVVESVTEPLQLLLIAVGVLSAIFGQIRDAIAIFVIIGLVAAVETVSEARAKTALRALRRLSAPTARVRRDGSVRVVPADEIVVGDVLELDAGDLVAADARVIRADGFGLDESALTGEPFAASKGEHPVALDASLGERSSMLYAGTAVVAGSGAGVVTGVGADSELGRLGQLVQDAKEPATPLQRAMNELARAALVLALAASVLVPLIGVLRGQPVRQMLLDGLTLAFATIPEELPILVTVLVAVGGLRLARQHVLLRKLRSAEAIGAVTVLLTDKTGTLTENRLRLEEIDGDREHLLSAAVAALGGVTPQDPLDVALAEAHGEHLSTRATRRFPFDPQRKRESAVWTDEATAYVAVKGAPERVLHVCAIAADERSKTQARVAHLAQQGLRVIAVAERRIPEVPEDVNTAETDLSFVGLAAFVDPLRSGVHDAVHALAKAGVRTVLVTGDHPLTALAIAQQAGLECQKALMGGSALESMSDDVLVARLTGDSVVARATPADKLRLVRLLQAHGEAVAVTGDGVNDAPALAAADVGIAMGARGTDLAREAADLVLTDDAYPTIVSAVTGGRGLGAQLRRAVAFYLGAKVALVTVIAVPLALGLASPFRPVQIVLLELFMDLGASVAFVSEPPSADAMSRPPRDPARRFLDGVQLSAMALCAVALTAAVLPTYLIVRSLAGTQSGSAAAVAAWLIAHAAIAWSVRVRPTLAFTRNVAFPGWALVASATAIVFAVTPAAEALGGRALDAEAFAITVAAAAAGAALAIVGRRVLALPRRL